MDERALSTIHELCNLVRETAYALHVFLGHGHFEKVYENALVHRLRKRQINVIPQHSLVVRDEDGTVIGDYLADLFVDGRPSRGAESVPHSRR